MSDPNYTAQPEAPVETHCPKCGGVYEGIIGFPGEWPCRCEPDEPDPDAGMEEYLFRKHGVKD